MGVPKHYNYGTASNYSHSNKNGDLRAFCDGSFDLGYVTVSWCIDSNWTSIRGVTIVPIGSDSIDAKRCELGGIYTILQIVECVNKYDELIIGKIELGYDCEGGLKRTLLRWKIFKTQFVSGSHLYLVSSINTIIKIVRFEVIGRHIPGK